MTASAEPPARQGPIWVVTDGRAGNENPALGLADRVVRRLGSSGPSVTVHRIRLRRFAEALPAPLWPLLGASAEGWPFRGLAEGADLGRQAADPAMRPMLAIGAGRRSAPVVAALGALTGGDVRTIQLLDAKLAPERFDLTIAPKHDGLTGPRRLATIGSLHSVDPAAPPPEDPRLPSGRRPRAALLIGGKSKSASFGAPERDGLLRAIQDLTARGAAIAATASRRTPEADAATLAAATREAGGFFWDGHGDNPYRALLFWADALIVTADSVNMASEACALGKPTFIAPAERLAPKFRAFHRALTDGGHARPLAEGLDLDGWTPTPLDDMTRATEAALAVLGR